MDLLLKVLDDLEGFLPHLVLVGGWVPFLYTRYLWKGVKQEPLTTTDIDFGLKGTGYLGKETITDRVIKKRYGEHHLRLGHDSPFVPVVQIKEKHLKADVEFIAALDLSSHVKSRLLGDGILLNKIKNFDVLLEKTMELPVESFRVVVPEPALFVFHKLLTFCQREEAEKQKKDLSYAYFVLLYSPDRDKLSREVRSLVQKHAKGIDVKKNIDAHFKDSNAKGPVWIAEGSMTTMISTIVPDVKEDSYQRIRGILES